MSRKTDGGIKTSISSTRAIFDSKGNYMPAGNYYFLIKKFENGLAIGDLTCKGDFGEFTFKIEKIIKMMAVAQARLARRANLKESGMPTYASPVTSPSHFFNSGSTINYMPSNTVINYKNQNINYLTLLFLNFCLIIDCNIHHV